MANPMFAAFRNSSFTYLWLGQLISGMGSALTTLASSILVYRLTGSALSVGLMLIATAGPTVFVGLLAGVFVDRYDRRRILLASDLLRAVFIFLVPFLVTHSMVWLYVIVALSSTIAQFFDSAHASVLPELASDEDLASANSFMAISSIGSTTVGFAAAGFLASTADLNLAFYLDALSFLISALLIVLARLPASANVQDTSAAAIGRNLLTGVRTVRDTSVLRSLFLMVLPIFIMFGLTNSLYLPFAVKVLGGSEFQFGLQQAAEAVGIVFGSLLMARLADRIREGQWLVLSYILMAIVGAAYATSSSMGIAIFLLGVSGFVNAPSVIGRQLVIQRATPRDMRGRVNSAFFVVRDVMFVVGMGLAGLADYFSVRLLLILGAAVVLVAAAVGAFLPGIGQPAAEWKRLIIMLRGIEAAPRLGPGSAARLADVNKFIAHRPELEPMSQKERLQLVSKTLVAQAAGGKVVIHRGETSDAAFFILRGSVGVGLVRDEEYLVLSILREGDFFGEVAALTGRTRTANVITEEDTDLLIIPAPVLKDLAAKYPRLGEVLETTMAERLSVTDLPLGTLLDQGLLRELRTNTLPAE